MADGISRRSLLKGLVAFQTAATLAAQTAPAQDSPKISRSTDGKLHVVYNRPDLQAEYTFAADGSSFDLKSTHPEPRASGQVVVTDEIKNGRMELDNNGNLIVTIRGVISNDHKSLTPMVYDFNRLDDPSLQGRGRDNLQKRHDAASDNAFAAAQSLANSEFNPWKNQGPAAQQQANQGAAQNPSDATVKWEGNRAIVTETVPGPVTGKNRDWKVEFSWDAGTKIVATDLKTNIETQLDFRGPGAGGGVGRVTVRPAGGADLDYTDLDNGLHNTGGFGETLKTKGQLTDRTSARIQPAMQAILAARDAALMDNQSFFDDHFPQRGGHPHLEELQTNAPAPRSAAPTAGPRQRLAAPKN